MEAPNRDADLGSKRRIQIGERLVEEKKLGSPHDRAAHRDALPLPTRQLARQSLHQFLEAEQGARLCHPRIDFGGRGFPELQTEGEILFHGEMRVERVALEHHRDVSVFRRQRRYVSLGNFHGSRVYLFEPGDDAKERGFAATARTHEHAKLAARQRHVDAAQDWALPKGLLDAARA